MLPNLNLYLSVVLLSFSSLIISKIKFLKETFQGLWMTQVNLSFMIRYSWNLVEICRNEFKNLFALMIFSIFYVLGFIDICFFWVIFQNVSPPTIFEQFLCFLVHNMAKYIEKKSYLSLLLTSNPFLTLFSIFCK